MVRATHRQFRIHIRLTCVQAVVGGCLDDSVHDCLLRDFVDSVFVLLRMSASPHLLFWAEQSRGAIKEVVAVPETLTVREVIPARLPRTRLYLLVQDAESAAERVPSRDFNAPEVFLLYLSPPKQPWASNYDLWTNFLGTQARSLHEKGECWPYWDAFLLCLLIFVGGWPCLDLLAHSGGRFQKVKPGQRSGEVLFSLLCKKSGGPMPPPVFECLPKGISLTLVRCTLPPRGECGIPRQHRSTGAADDLCSTACGSQGSQSYNHTMRHLGLVDGELAFVDPSERSGLCEIGSRLVFAIFEWRGPDSGAWLACTVDPRALEKSEEDFHEFVLLIYRKASNTRCWVSMTERHMSFADDHLLAELGKEGTSFTDMATMCVIKVTAME